MANSSSNQYISLRKCEYLLGKICKYRKVVKSCYNKSFVIFQGTLKRRKDSNVTVTHTDTKLSKFLVLCLYIFFLLLEKICRVLSPVDNIKENMKIDDIKNATLAINTL